MSQQTHERAILTTGTFAITTHDGEQVEVSRDLLVWENANAEWFIAVSEPNPDDPEGNALSLASIAVPIDAAPVFDELFQLITDPAGVKA